MKLRHVAILAVVALSLAACGRRRPAAPTPTPNADSIAAAEAAARARADSIRLAEEAARQAAEAERARALGIERARAALTDIVFFDFDSDALSAEAQDRLRLKAAILSANPVLQLRVEGHADERGSTEYNLALGQRRAESVRTFLTGYGIAGERIGTLSYGEERPRAQGSGEEAWSQNRRAEFVPTEGEITTVPPEVQQ